MSWHDFFYFSKGERRALIVLLCFISIAGILLVMNDKNVHDEDSVIGVKEYAPTGDAQKQNPANRPSDPFTGSNDNEDKRSSSDGVLKPSRSSPSSKNGFRSGTPPDGNRNVLQNRPEENKTAGVAVNKEETVSERVKRITSSSRPSYPRTEKFEKGVVVELNAADTAILKKIPGIGSSFARRIVGYRNLLGGYYSVTQLSEVYGIDEDRYNAFVPWFTADPSLINKLQVNELSLDSLRRHPYIDYNQAKMLVQLRRQKGKLTGWENLQLLSEFMDSDKIRLQYYLSFE
jgi:DNA uptake protein ComE-like DNA-binding protein